MKRNMAEKLTASILAAVLTFGMMAPQTAMTAEAAAKSTLEKDVQKLVKKSKAKKEKTQKKKLKKLFQYVEKNYGYARAIGFKNSRGWEKTFTAEMIKNKKAAAIILQPCMHFWQKNPVWRQGSALAGPTALIKQDGRIMHGVK